MRELIIIATMLLIAAFSCASVRDEQAQTVLIANVGFLGGGRGSGVLLDSTHVLTCAHMGRGMKDEFFVYTYPLGSVVRAKVEFVDVSVDLLILRLAQPVVVQVPPRFEHHWTEGDPVTVVGNALGSMKWVVTRGVLSGEERDFILTDARVNPGNSGGPWFNADGDIIALTDWGIGPQKNVEGINGGIAARVIEDFLARAKAVVSIADKLQGV